MQYATQGTFALAQNTPTEMNMAATVLCHAADLPNKTALQIVGRDHTQTWTYAELEQAVLSTASHLVTLGCQPTERVILSLGNIAAFPITFLACLAADLVPVVTSAALTDSELNAIICDVAPKLMVSSLRSPQQGKALGVATIPPIQSDKIVEQSLSGYCLGDAQRTAYIVYTSGSSGTPRAVCHAHRVIQARRLMWDGWYGLRPTDRMFHAGAFNWTFTLGTGLMDPWSIGATAIIPEPGTPPEDLGPLIRASRPTLFAAAPAIYRKLLKNENDLFCHDLRHGLSAGEKMPQFIHAQWQKVTGTKVYEAFGMSECSTFISGSPTRPAAQNSIGFPQEGRKVAVLDEMGHPVKPGETGIIAISENDPGLMLGYLTPEGTTDKPITNGWFLTGDLGHMDEGGSVIYEGRSDDMMNPGGIRLSPAEVERALMACDGIEDCAVTEVEIKSDVKVIAAFYVSTFEIDESHIRKRVTSTLAPYKCPRLYVRLDQLPRNANGKVQRQKLRRIVEEHNDKT